MSWIVNSMDQEAAAQISRWRYPYPYSIYDMPGTNDCQGELLAGNYFMLHDENGVLQGYFCIGEAAIVPSGKAFGVYDDSSLIDIGFGMNPGLCGRGGGADFVRSGLAFAQEKLGATGFRLTVASFNRRAVRVYERNGFRTVDSFVRRRPSGEMEFLIMQKDKVL